MKISKRLLLLIILILNCILTSACWNYREIEQMAIVMGLAIDKSEDGEFLVTAEVIDPRGGKELMKEESIILEAKGRTIFHAIRHLIATSGRKLYWAHSKVVVVSKKIATSDMISMLDWVSRDQEIRLDMWVVASEEVTAGEILKNQPKLESSISLQIDGVCRAQKNLPSFPATRLYDFVDEMASATINPVLPSVKVLHQGNENSVVVLNTVLFKHKKMIGSLGHDDSETLQFIKNLVKGGLYEVEKVGDEETIVTLEIFGNKTTAKPVYSNGKIVMKINVKPTVSIAEISSSRDVISKEGREILKDTANKQMENEIKNLIKKVQNEYQSDIFGFGKQIKINEPKLWKEIEPIWEDVFVKIEPQVKVDFQIKGSATTKKPLKVAD